MSEIDQALESLRKWKLSNRAALEMEQSIEHPESDLNDDDGFDVRDDSGRSKLLQLAEEITRAPTNTVHAHVSAGIEYVIH
jgi:hypothetical protein